MNTPIFNALTEYMDKKGVSFHMPGHKGKNTLIDWGKYIPYIDVTEIEGMDNLHNPTGIIEESQRLSAKAFHAEKTFFSVNGTTGGIYIALAAATDPGDKILIQRNCHKSVYNGIILNRLIPEYIYPHYNKKYNLITGINPEDIELILSKDSDIKAVVVTYPTYYGICSNIEEISRIVHKYNKILIVDEAHGSHFVFSPHLPISSLEAGADIVVQSTHKTLPSFTQTSMIHVGTDRVNIDKLKTMSSLYQTTSPSYIFMASLDIAREYMETKGEEKLDSLFENIDYTLNRIRHMNNVFVFEGDAEDDTIWDFDKTKIILRINGMKGTELQRVLNKKYNIQLEMADYYYGLILTTLMNDREDFEKLISALTNIKKIDKNIPTLSVDFPPVNQILSPWEAFYGNKEECKLKDAVGKVSGEFVVPYPPGVPLICPGEEITPEIYEKIRFLKENSVEIIGLLDYNIEKIRTIK